MPASSKSLTKIDFCAIAGASGYPSVSAVASAKGVRGILSEPSPELQFIHVPILKGVSEDLPRPSVSPGEVARRLRRFLE